MNHGEGQKKLKSFWPLSFYAVAIADGEANWSVKPVSLTKWFDSFQRHKIKQVAEMVLQR